MTGTAADRARGSASAPETAQDPVGQAPRGVAAGGSIRASIPRILAGLREIEGLNPATMSNLLSLGTGLSERLAHVAADRWANATSEMMDGWCDGAWVDPETGRRPGQSPVSRKQRRWAARRVVRAAVAAGLISPDSAIAGSADGTRPRKRPAHGDADHVALTIELWCPGDERSRAATPLLGIARAWVKHAEPPTASAAVTWLRVVTDALLWSEAELGTADADYVLHPHNIETFAMGPARGWSDGWRAQARSVLRRVGRAVCPHLWPDGPQRIGARDAAAPYSTVDEFLFRESAAMAGRRLRCERLWLAAATLGAGLRGTEARGRGPADLVSLDGGRLGVAVHRDRQRVVPVRAAYTDLVREASELCDRDRFFDSDSPAAASNVATRLAVQGLGRLELHRARATFVCAHIRSGTPLDVLNEIAGPITGSYLQQMLSHCTDPAGPVDAANRGLAA